MEKEKEQNITLNNPRTLQLLMKSTEAQAYVMAFLSFFTLAFFTIFAIRPTLISFFNLRQQIQDAQAVDIELGEKIKQLLTAQQIYQEYQDELVLLDSALPMDPEFAQLIQKLENIVNDHEATTTAFATNAEVTLLDTEQILNVQITPVPDDLVTEENAVMIVDIPTESIKFSMAINSGYLQSESVINHLLNLKRLFAISSLNLARSGETDQGTAGVDTVIDAEAFYLLKKQHDE